MRHLGLKSRKEWNEYCKSGNKPDDIPSSPEGTYKKRGWLGVGDWLGTGVVQTSNREFRPFEEAREFVRSLNLKNNSEWREYHKSGSKPDDIPANPGRTYSNEGWQGYGDWLGTGTREYRAFEVARDFVQSLNLKNNMEWREYCKSGNKPDNIPTTPDYTYKNKGWQGYGDWLGTGNIANRDKEYRPFEDAREFVRKLDLKSRKEWNEYCKSGYKPDDIPAYPNGVYKNKGWQGVSDWLGTKIE